MELQASAGQYTHLDGSHSRVPVGQFKSGRIAQERQPHLTNAVLGDPLVSDQAWAAREGMIAFAGYPLVIETRVVGVMALFARRALTEATFQALAAVAHGIAVGIQRKQAEALLVRHAADLQRSNDALRQFGRIVSHDLQEPLRTVTSFVQLLAKRQRGRLDAESNEFINFAVDGAERMQVLIRDLLVYTRVGSQAPAFTAVQCDTVLARTMQDLHGAITDTAAVITHEPLPTVPGDAQQLGLVLQNLLSNALKFRTQAPPHIHITASQQAAEWVFAVQDDGIGLDAQHAEHIFGVFQRLHTRQEYSGTGLGLAICKTIVERHGGRIWVESRPGHGATFFFTLPVHSARE